MFTQLNGAYKIVQVLQVKLYILKFKQKCESVTNNCQMLLPNFSLNIKVYVMLIQQQ